MSLTWTTPAWLWPLLLVLAAGAVICTLVIYGRTRPTPGPGLARTLTGLRSAALVLLVLAIAGPVISRLFREEEPGKLVIVVEDSASMALVDSDPGEGSTGAGENTVSETAISRWQESLDFSADIQTELEGLGWSGETVLLRGNGLSPIEAFALDDPVIPPPTARGTNLDGLLQQVTDFTQGQDIRAVLLVADGNQTETGYGRSGSYRAPLGKPKSAAGPVPAPLFIAGAGDPQGSADRLIKDLRYPEMAFVADELVIEFVVTHRFFDDQELPPVTVRLTEDGQILAEQEFQLDSSTSYLELPFVPDFEGMHLYELEVSPLVNERFLANNKVSLAINVRPEKSRLLLIGTQPGWDTRFMAQAALDEARVDLEVVYRSAAGLVFADSLTSWQEPNSPELWNEYDGVILQGWRERDIQLDWDVLAEAIEAGLGFMVLPRAQAPGSRLADPLPPALKDILPVSAERLRWVEGPFTSVVPSAATHHPILNLVATLGGAQSGQESEPAQALAGLPPIRRTLGTVTGPNSVLLIQSKIAKTQGATMPLPLLVAGSRGLGRVVWFGGQRLWELAFWQEGMSRANTPNEGVNPAQILLKNLLVWLAAGQEESGLNFSGGRSFYQEGEPISLKAQWRDMRGQPVLDRTLTLLLQDETTREQAQTERSFLMSEVSGQPGLNEVTLPPLPPGRYSLQLRGDSDPPRLSPAEALVVVPHSIEDTQVRQDYRQLDQLATRLAGTRLTLTANSGSAVAQDELARLDWGPSSRVKRARLDFWSGWPFLVLVAGLLGAEWYLRRRNGLL